MINMFYLLFVEFVNEIEGHLEPQTDEFEPATPKKKIKKT